MNPFMKVITEVFSASKPPARFTLDSEYDPDTHVVHFIIYADQWHSLPEDALVACATWLNERMTILRNRGIIVALEKRDDKP